MGRRHPESLGGRRELTALCDGNKFVYTFPAVLVHGVLSLPGNNVLLLAGLLISQR
jgi:hypothetical protein